MHLGTALGILPWIRDFFSRNASSPGAATERDAYAFTPLLYASCSGRLDVVRLLANKKVPVPSEAVFVASSDENLEILKLLLEHGDDPIARVMHPDQGILTALWRAAQYRHDAIVRALLERGANADVLCKSSRSGETNPCPAVMVACRGWDINSSMIKLLASRTTRSAKYIDMAFKEAAVGDYWRTARVLCNQYTDPVPLLHTAIRCDARSKFFLVLEHFKFNIDAQIAARHEGELRSESFLARAIRYDSPLTTSYLLKRGLRFDRGPQRGQSMVHAAIRKKP